MNRCPYTGEAYCIYGEGLCPVWGTCGVYGTEDDEDDEEGDNGRSQIL